MSFQEDIKKIRESSDCVLVCVGAKRERKPEKRIIDESFTVKIPFGTNHFLIHEDLVEAFNFATEKYPEADISVVEAFLVNPKQMDNLGIIGAAGCYIAAENTILIRTSNSQYFYKNAIDKKLSNYINNNCELKRNDIFVHELFHALSHKMMRQRKNVFIEEDFAYRGMIGWLKKNGCKDVDIIRTRLMPYLISWVMEKKIKVDKAKVMSTEEAQEAFDKIIECSTELGKLMVFENKHEFQGDVDMYDENRFSNM